MKKEVLAIAIPFISFALNTKAIGMDANFNPHINDIDTHEETMQIANEADEYLAQLLIQHRYVSALSIVWVYGCADKS